MSDHLATVTRIPTRYAMLDASLFVCIVHDHDPDDDPEQGEQGELL